MLVNAPALHMPFLHRSPARPATSFWSCAVGPGLLPVTPRLKEALQRSIDSAFTLFQFTVCCGWVVRAPCLCCDHQRALRGERNRGSA